MLRASAFIALLFMASGFSASAQDRPPERTENITVRAGQMQRLAFYPAAKRDCTRTPLPEIRLLDEPRNGRVIVRRVSIKASSDSACPNQDIPGVAVFFIAKQGYTGADNARYDIQVANRKATVKINVRVIGGKLTPRDTTDL